MNTINDGGPFHPVALRLEDGDMAVEKLKHPGVSLRAWLAGMAMQGLLHGSGYGAELQRIFDHDRKIADSGERLESPQTYTARIALGLADALIAELEKEAK